VDSPYVVIYRPVMHHHSRSLLVVMLCVMIGHFRWLFMVRQIVVVSYNFVLWVLRFDGLDLIQLFCLSLSYSLDGRGGYGMQRYGGYGGGKASLLLFVFFDESSLY